ncbi:hypothetical protein [Streptomyces sp. NPDC006668]|uniref:hypothetical protein n=1 Tax=Streptomyces sp. NPDC006668 TaxID=3156903 RepID=UPI0033EEE4D8
MQPEAPTLDVQLDLSSLAASALKWADRTRSSAMHSPCNDQDEALTVVAFQLNTARHHLGRGDTNKAREALSIASNYAHSEEANTPRRADVTEIANATRTLLTSLPR